MTKKISTALITGASSGIGIDLAFEFAKRGHHLVLLARREDRLKQVRKDILAQYPHLNIHLLVQDLIQKNAVAEIQTFLRAHHIDIDYLVNNAGFGLRGVFHELQQQAQLDMIELNVTRLTQLCHHFLPSMLAKNHGGILNVASIAAFQPGPKMSVYFASKAFVLFLSEGIYEEIKGSPILVSTLCPGPTASEFGKIADMDGTRLFDHNVMASAKVARMGVDGFFRNQAVVITGASNNILAFTNRFVPRFLVRKIAHFLQK